MGMRRAIKKLRNWQGQDVGVITKTSNDPFFGKVVSVEKYDVRFNTKGFYPTQAMGGIESLSKNKIVDAFLLDIIDD